MTDFETKCQKQLEVDEKRSANLYYDSFNIPTIGIGRNLKRGLSEDEIDYLFHNDFTAHLDELLEAFPWSAELDDARRGALLNMAFNMGVPRLRGFKNMLSALQEGRWKDAKREALNSVWASQVKAGRANRVAIQLETGEWQ